MKKKFLKHGIILNIVFVMLLMDSAITVYCQSSINDLDKFDIQHLISTYVRRSYIDTININTLLDGAIQGMIEKLDPHSSYMPPLTATDFDERIRGNFQGIGITFSMINDKITVIDVIENGPSERAGLKSRDKIIIIDGEYAVSISSDEVKERLRGHAGSKVWIEVERTEADKRLKFTITRAEVELNSVSHSYMIDDITGYIAISRFTLNTKYDVSDALVKLKDKGMKRLLLDLRNNSGGSLDSAIGVVDHFIKEGTIVATKGRRDTNNIKRVASGYGNYVFIPMIVLINHASASASEIVAGGLQDHDRALIVGQTSFGKGIVMNPFNLKNRDKDLGTLVLSVAHYYTPSGRLIQRPYDGSREDYIKEGFDDYDPNALDAEKEDRPVYLTDLGREVYGGGGITPDKILTSLGRLNSFELALRGLNPFFEFTDEYLIRNNDIPEDFNEFLLDYHIPEHEITFFREFVIGKGVKIDNTSLFREDLKKLFKKYDIPEERINTLEKSLVDVEVDLDETLFEKSIDYIEREIKMEIARMIWGTEERYRVWHTDDTELSSALSYFEEAEDLLKKRLAIGKL